MRQLKDLSRDLQAKRQSFNSQVVVAIGLTELVFLFRGQAIEDVTDFLGDDALQSIGQVQELRIHRNQKAK
jgi:hypothetical protein